MVKTEMEMVMHKVGMEMVMVVTEMVVMVMVVVMVVESQYNFGDVKDVDGGYGVMQINLLKVKE